MPWTSRSARKHTKKARSKPKKKQWAAVANSVLKRTGNEGYAVRAANAAVKKKRRKQKPKRRRT